MSPNLQISFKIIPDIALSVLNRPLNVESVGNWVIIYLIKIIALQSHKADRVFVHIVAAVNMREPVRSAPPPPGGRPATIIRAGTAEPITKWVLTSQLRQ